MTSASGPAGRVVPPHYLRGNESTWTPPQVISFDTETRVAAGPNGETHTLRCWTARLDSRRPDSAGWTGHDTATGRTAAELAAQLDAWCAGQRCVWCFAHNLSFDLVVARLPAAMAALGWTVTDHAAGSDTPWLRMGRGGRTLTLADSWGWLRQPIAGVAAALGAVKPPLPADGDTEAAWLARCHADTAILAEALMQVMDWWDAAGLGRWSLTGSHSGWNVMRHMMPRRKIAILPDETGAAADRAAIYGGRRECFTWGDAAGGPFVEYDFAAAYPTVAARLPLPSRRMYRVDHLPLDSPLVRGAGLAVIAAAVIETPVPRWPCRIGGRVWYPVGRFATVLAGPELADAARLGALRQVGPGWVHGLGYALAPWAQWVLDVQSGAAAGVPAVAVPMVKHWGRAVIGKFGARGFAKADAGPAPGAGWSYLPVWDIGRQAHGALVTIGGRRWKCLQTQAGDNAYPAILAYVESYVRVALGRALDAAPAGSVICCDTDGLLLGDCPDPDAVITQAGTGPLTLRAKQSYRRVTVVGPQHTIRDGRRRYSGVPGSAVECGDGKLRALIWPRLAWQMREHAGEGYRRPAAEYTIGASYASGWVTDDGAVLPVEVQIDPSGVNRPVGWAQTRHAASGAVLGPVQAPAVLRACGLGEGGA